jgi:serine/threonine-protein kinase HipA
MAVSAYFGITPGRAQAILGEVEAAVGRWRAEGRFLGMTPRELDSYADAFEHPQREAARRAL